MVQRIKSKYLLFISTLILLTCFPIPAIVLKVLINGVKFYLTGELNESY